jgi:Ohr subfamily peroxiredoxin
MPTVLDNVVYTAHAHTTGGRDGRSYTEDMHLDVKLALPTEMGGNGKGTNPEQLFAAGYSACFMSALKHVGSLKKLKLPPEAKIDAHVSIGPVATGFALAVKMDIHLPGVEHEVAKELVDAAHQICPYSNATRGNIVVDLQLV